MNDAGPLVSKLPDYDQEARQQQAWMQVETISKSDDVVIRRLILEPGEAMPWHTDSCSRFTVVVEGELLAIEFRDTGERRTIQVHPGLADWDQPEARVHRGVNAGSTPYEEVVIFFLPEPDVDVQPELS